jgi:hypothetical protein
MSNKTISINPGLFNLGVPKTKKNRDKKQVPLISPNVLKNKLLKRIKEHKQRETENLDNNKRKLLQPKDNIEFSKASEISTYSDEFSDSLNYLQTLSKQRKINDEKINYEKQKQKQKQDLERKTVKNYHSINTSFSQPLVNIDLPEELQQPLITINTENFTTNEQQPITIKQYNKDTIPYGILKGGTKPTYRDWNKTQRNNIVTNPTAALIISDSTINKEKSEREKRLQNLREKLKMKQEEVNIEHNCNCEDINITQKLIQKPNIITDIQNIHSSVVVDESNLFNEQIIAIKKITKKTIKRKYTLGRSKIKKTIAVLIKDRKTRKQILNAQKDLKKKSINDIKMYLRDHNLIKVGSNAPNDVIRKMYESSMLAGEITNSNAEILLHNFSKDDKEL